MAPAPTSWMRSGRAGEAEAEELEVVTEDGLLLTICSLLSGDLLVL